MNLKWPIHVKNGRRSNKFASIERAWDHSQVFARKIVPFFENFEANEYIKHKIESYMHKRKNTDKYVRLWTLTRLKACLQAKQPFYRLKQFFWWTSLPSNYILSVRWVNPLSNICIPTSHKYEWK